MDDVYQQALALHKMHGRIANFLQLPIKKTFDPHMTLINTHIKNYDKDISLLHDFDKPIIDAFVLSFGCSDNVGQLTDYSL